MNFFFVCFCAMKKVLLNYEPLVFVHYIYMNVYTFYFFLIHYLHFLVLLFALYMFL